MFTNFHAQLCLYDELETVGKFDISQDTANNLRILQNLNLIDRNICKRWEFVRTTKKHPKNRSLSPQVSSTPDEELIRSARKRKPDAPMSASAEFRKKQMKEIFQTKNI